ncbi:SRPBCC family protein [Vitiosangium sp. GDMCC 1.1324]|uniref:SRPBCC family protein n=1 Tax=Vitiosangium sp. (strain GDMCC 1.1324) TaxID=2138576 RepID=UPI00130ED9DE|nr:SRPBCC family protein [Vitiosangium sp. GDMCC 1.1324]
METSVTNEIVINKSPDIVYRCCTQVESWPGVFPTCLAVRQNALNGNTSEVVMEMTVRNTFGTHTIRSHRKYTHENQHIQFKMLTVPPQFNGMHGTWSVEPCAQGARLVVIHTFEPAQSTAESRDELGRTVYANTHQVLTHLKAWAERI